MRVSIEARGSYLRVEVAGRETPEEGRSVVERIIAEQARTGLKNILVIVRESPAMFRVESWEFSAFATRLAGIPGLRIALASDAADLYASQQYIALLSKQRALDVAAFPHEASALAWLLAERRSDLG